MLATLTFLPQTRLRPTQKIRMDPIRDRLAMAASVMTGAIKRQEGYAALKGQNGDS